MPADWMPPSARARPPAPSTLSLKSSGRPVAASPRKLTNITRCRKRWYGVNRTIRVAPVLMTPAPLPAERCLRAMKERGNQSQRVNAEEQENAAEQDLHELVGPIERRAPVPVVSCRRGGRTSRSSRSLACGTGGRSRRDSAAEMAEAGLLSGRMSWWPWQSLQVATRVNPSAVTWPWNVSRYVEILSTWQVPHSSMAERRHWSVSAR